MNYIKNLAFLMFLSLDTLCAVSQTNPKESLSLNNGTINNQFDYVIQKSSSWKNEEGQLYKVIKNVWLTQLKTHTLDSLKAIHEDLLDTQTIVSNQKKEIADLNTKLSNIQVNLDKTNSKKNSISLFGIQMSKTGYNAFMWTIIAGLLGVFLLFVYKFNDSNKITKDAKLALTELEKEFEEHRKTALEREQKVRRQLIDEINKQKTSKSSK